MPIRKNGLEKKKKKELPADPVLICINFHEKKKKKKIRFSHTKIN